MKRTFHDAFGSWEGKPPQLSVYSCAAQTCYSVLNLTQDKSVVQFSSAPTEKFPKNPSNCRNNNDLSALTPPRTVAIISDSVRSAEVHLGLYV